MENVITPRPSVMAFARAMEDTLRKHDAKKGGQNGANGRSGWRQDRLTGLIDHAEEELCEIQEAMSQKTMNGNDVAREAVDLGNMAMMIWDRCLQRTDAVDDLDCYKCPACDRWQVYTDEGCVACGHECPGTPQKMRMTQWGLEKLNSHIRLRRMELVLDNDDFETIQEEIKQRVEKFSTHPLPEGDSNSDGAILAGCIRDLDEYRKLADAELEARRAQVSAGTMSVAEVRRIEEDGESGKAVQ